MKNKQDYSIVAIQYFIQATRDSGYKGTVSAIAELIDNSFEALATEVDIELVETKDKPGYPIKIIVHDNGIGMNPSTLRLGLQFGGSTKFNSRKGMGRYGMGLPNSSLSQSRRVEVYSWTNSNYIYYSYLDIDEIIEKSTFFIPAPIRVKRGIFNKQTISQSGTTIVWSNCDRLDNKSIKTLSTKLHKLLGKIFREYLWKGKIIRINGVMVNPVDPLLYRKGSNLTGASLYGSELKYAIKVPNSSQSDEEYISTVTVTFTEFPIEKWHNFSNEEKGAYGITKKAGVSIIRADREIDYGWYFMGNKRKENYDDWWRCEIKFSPELDELFGVTHTKQEIHPTEIITSILSPDLEKIAHKLNSRVREKYIKVKQTENILTSTLRAKKNDLFLEPPMINTIKPVEPIEQKIIEFKQVNAEINKDINRKKVQLYGLSYKLEHKTILDPSFFVPIFLQDVLTVILNEQHPFFEKVYIPIVNSTDFNSKIFRNNIELLLFAIARAESCVTTNSAKEQVISLRRMWSNTLATFLL